MQLREWQQSFQQVVLGTTILGELPLQEKGIAPVTSMAIYANAYRERLHAALRDNYPALHQVLGDNDFAELAYAFIAAQPPQTASIRWFGAELPHYLILTEPYCSCPALSEIARFEWALRHTVDAADAERIDANYLQVLDAEQWENFECDVHPSLTILHFAWNAPQVWRALEAGEEPPAPTPFDSYWFVYRGADLMSEWRSADAYEAEAIQQWSRGANFGAICQFIAVKIGLAEKIGDAPCNDENESAVATAASFMRTWIEQGLLVHSQRGEKQ